MTLSALFCFIVSFPSNFTSRFFKDDFLIEGFNITGSLESEAGNDLVNTLEC